MEHCQLMEVGGLNQFLNHVICERFGTESFQPSGEEANVFTNILKIGKFQMKNDKCPLTIHLGPGLSPL